MIREATQAELRRKLDYDPETGLFTRRNATAVKYKGGEIAGTLTANGYIQIYFKGKCQRAHRLAFLWMTGEFPADQVDHINGIRTDNRWANLREASPVSNGKNQAIRSTNSSGVTGIGWAKHVSKWRAQITHLGKNIHLGYFAEISDAIKARAEADKEYGFHKNHGRVPMDMDLS